MSSFRCKQFIIRQDNVGLRVNTDSLILGSWSQANQLGKQAQILDIGSGSGILSLMLAQKTDETVMLDAIDIAEVAYLQTLENIQASKFSHRIQAKQQDINQFNPDNFYDWIISNPPYFSGIKPDNKNKSYARHTQHLSWQALFLNASRLLNSHGVFEMVAPYTCLSEIKQAALQSNLFLSHLVKIKPKMIEQEVKRVCLRFSRMEITKPIIESLVIYDEQNQYTSEYKTLCRDYYLKF
ncbi:tRNA1(Val) (adenine(37)-N6)-methyltransferase [Catenovulum maritimum]|uniref:tRNA1(Val) (adenine(37)-N6)-methyltransferase n=1 Tax=Catenovulum maritimum TaxID=1513271 RepID=A0A0J8JL13_9ALTE|nr:methyltransferase [Catenovulum maritimum]KMT65241.1 hypothetical protein XM47_09355 [Catenovulum maritimum]